MVQTHIFILDCWLMPNRSFVHNSYQMNFYWKLRLDCFASSFIFDEHKAFYLRRGWAGRNSCPLSLRSDDSFWPIQFHSHITRDLVNLWAILFRRSRAHSMSTNTTFIPRIMFILHISEIRLLLCQGSSSCPITIGYAFTNLGHMVVCIFALS